MSMSDDQDDYLDISYSQAGMGQRLPLMLCLDISSSMQGEPIRKLNEALGGWAAHLRSDAHQQGSVFVGIVTFGAGGVRAWRGREPLPPGSGQSPFVPAADFEPPEFTAGGVTRLTEALELAVRHVNAYKGMLKDNHYQYYRPLIFLMTDGLPTDESGKATDSWERIVPDIRSGMAGKNFQLFAIGVGSLSPRGRQVLQKLAPEGFHILGGFPFESLLRQLSASINEMMRSPAPESADYTLRIGDTAGNYGSDPLGRLFGQRPAGS
jgi:uncharacterized protein YegL